MSAIRCANTERSIPETASQVAHSGIQHSIGEEVSSTGDEFALEVPAIDTTWCGTFEIGLGGVAIPRSGYNVKVISLLETDELRDEFWLLEHGLVEQFSMRVRIIYMVREISIHDNHEVASAEIQTMNIRCPSSILSDTNQSFSNLHSPKTQFSRSGFQNLMKHLVSGVRKLEKATYNLIFTVHLRQLSCHVLRAVRTRIIDNYDLPAERATFIVIEVCVD